MGVVFVTPITAAGGTGEGSGIQKNRQGYVQKLKRVNLAGVFVDVRIDQRLGLWSNFLR